MSCREIPKSSHIRFQLTSQEKPLLYVQKGNFQSNLDKIQHKQNHSARVIEQNFDYINTRGIESIDLVHNLGWMDVSQNRPTCEVGSERLLKGFLEVDI